MTSQRTDLGTPKFVLVDQYGTPLTAAQIGGSPDTELPAAGALGDDTANPTIPAVGAFLHAFDGSTWDRVRGNSTGQHLARRKVSPSQFAAAAAGDYASGDVISQSASADVGVARALASVVDVAGEVAKLTGVVAKCSEDSIAATMRLHWFSANPTAAQVEMDDNVAFDIKTSAGLAIHLGYTDLPAFADGGTAESYSQVHGLKQYLATGATTGLWFLPVFTAAETNETAGMTFDFDFYFEN